MKRLFLFIFIFELVGCKSTPFEVDEFHLEIVPDEHHLHLLHIADRWVSKTPTPPSDWPQDECAWLTT